MTNILQPKSVGSSVSGRRTAFGRNLWAAMALVALALLALLIGATSRCPPSAPRPYRQVVILGDPHLPGRNLAAKEQVRRTINGWRDVDLVVAVGDICDLYGTPAEYAAAREFFNRLNHPLALVNGNHDYIYATPASPEAYAKNFNPASKEERAEKLTRFRQTFRLSTLSSSRMVGGYLFLFLAADHDRFAVGISEQQMNWLRTELAHAPRTPTIIVFHGPLKGTQYPFKRHINQPHSVAQPVEAIQALLAANPQVFLWISGHTHTPATEASFASPINLYDGRLTNIHNPDMKRETIWTNSLLLYPDQVVVKTYNHLQGAWLPELTRVIRPPKL
ncbi:MAG: metallophosphoesterase [Proteobacteria bacterium]|nr:metallophosphoesterase [Pseudomonadota bacterium]